MKLSKLRIFKRLRLLEEDQAMRRCCSFCGAVHFKHGLQVFFEATGVAYAACGNCSSRAKTAGLLNQKQYEARIARGVKVMK